MGFFNQVGVGLNAPCLGQNVAVLLTSNRQYNEMLSTLLAAQASGATVQMYQLTSQSTAGNPIFAGFTYCVITPVSLGTFPLWQ